VSNENGPAPLAQGDAGPENFAATKPLGSAVKSTANSPQRATVAHLPLPWAQQLIANGGDDFPEYRSREWMALDDRDPRKVAGCVAAAEAWWESRSQPADVFAFPSTRRIREIAEARRARPGDHLGGRVAWERSEVAR
jgi:hypothetical protein